MNEEMTRCIETCPSYYKTCLSMAMNHLPRNERQLCRARPLPPDSARSGLLSRHQVRLCSYRSRTS
jgi:hypothetical protein